MKRVERLLSMAGIREPNLNFYDLITWDYLLMDCVLGFVVLPFYAFNFFIVLDLVSVSYFLIYNLTIICLDFEYLLPSQFQYYTFTILSYI